MSRCTGNKDTCLCCLRGRAIIAEGKNAKLEAQLQTGKDLIHHAADENARLKKELAGKEEVPDPAQGLVDALKKVKAMDGRCHGEIHIVIDEALKKYKGK